MKNFKTICNVDKGNGVEKHILYITANDVDSAESFAKYFIIENHPEWTFYGVEGIPEEI